MYIARRVWGEAGGCWTYLTQVVYYNSLQFIDLHINLSRMQIVHHVVLRTE